MRLDWPSDGRRGAPPGTGLCRRKRASAAAISPVPRLTIGRYAPRSSGSAEGELRLLEHGARIDTGADPHTDGRAADADRHREAVVWVQSGRDSLFAGSAEVGSSASSAI